MHISILGFTKQAQWPAMILKMVKLQDAQHKILIEIYFQFSKLCRLCLQTLIYQENQSYMLICGIFSKRKNCIFLLNTAFVEEGVIQALTRDKGI